MKHISILVPRGYASLVNIAGSYLFFSTVNDLLRSMGRDALFEPHLVGLDRNTVQTSGLFGINPDKLTNEVDRTDLVIIPAIHSDLDEGIARNGEFIPWIVEQRAKGAELASFCVGAFFLAATGLLNGKSCSTHWMHANAFRAKFPEVNVVDDRILTEEDGIYTSGGAYAALNLQLYLAEKYAGRDVAILAAKTFMIDIDRHSQSPFIMFQGQREHGDNAIKAVQDYIEDHVADKLSVEDLADRVAMGRRSLERRFRKATNNSVAEYIQRVKMEAAKKRLESGRETVFEVMYDVGYSDVKAFRDVFKKTTGMTPVDYRTKYSKAASA